MRQFKILLIISCMGLLSSCQIAVDYKIPVALTTLLPSQQPGGIGPALATKISIGANIKELSASVYHTCALLMTGDLGYEDMVGRGATAGSMAALTGVNLGSGRTAKAIAAGDSHTCAIMDNNQAKCWGGNQGQLGLNDKINRGGKAGDMATLPVIDVGTGQTVKTIASGANSTCVILDTDQIKCFGGNSWGAAGLWK